MEQLYHLADEASELVGHVFRVGSLQHQQHLLIQRFIQWWSKAHVGGQVINPMKALQKDDFQIFTHYALCNSRTRLSPLSGGSLLAWSLLFCLIWKHEHLWPLWSFMCNNFLLALLDQHFNTVGRFPALATLCRLSKTEKRKEPYKEEWGERHKRGAKRRITDLQWRLCQGQFCLQRA